MARYLLATGVDRFKGSLQGSTFQRSGKVFSIRKRNVPVQKRSSAQSQVKNHFDFVQKRWKNLSGAEQASFAAETGNNLRTDSLGNTYELRADQLQSSTNLNQISTEQPPIDTIQSPIAFVPITVDAFTLDISAPVFDIVPQLPNVQTGCNMNVFIMRMQVTQRAFSKADCRLLGTLPSGFFTPFKDWYPDYIALFPGQTFIVGQFIPIYIEIVQNDSGQVIGTLQDYANIQP